MVADGPTIAKHGDLSAWLGKAHYDVLKSEVVYCLDPGDSVFLPLGSRPIIVALPTSEECGVAPAPPQKAKKDSKSTPKFTKADFAVYVATLLFDSEFDAPQEHKQYALTNYVSALGKAPNSIRTNAQVQAWRTSLEPKEDAAIMALPPSL